MPCLTLESHKLTGTYALSITALIALCINGTIIDGDEKEERKTKEEKIIMKVACFLVIMNQYPIFKFTRVFNLVDTAGKNLRIIVY